MKIHDLLKKDHEKFKKLLNQISAKKDLQLLAELKKEVYVHSEAEEEAYYEPLQDKIGKLKIIVKSGHDEHDLVMKMFKKLDHIENEEEWSALFAVIKKSLESHILMEEDDIFKLADKYLTPEEGEDIANDMDKAKTKFEKACSKL